MILLSSWTQAKTLIREALVAVARSCLAVTAARYEMASGQTLVFAPHQDDETLGCGALIARKRMCGFPVDVVFITDGSASHPAHLLLDRGAIATVRKREALAALDILGVESGAIHFLGEPDGSLGQLEIGRRESLVEKICECLRTIRPTEIFLPCSNDASSEHDASFGFVLEALGKTSLQPAIWQYPVWAWWNPLTLFDRIFWSDGRCRVPAEDYLALKEMAVGCYRSQTDPLPPDQEAALPGKFIRLFLSKNEFFFRYNYHRKNTPTRPGHGAIV